MARVIGLHPNKSGNIKNHKQELLKAPISIYRKYLPETIQKSEFETITPIKEIIKDLLKHCKLPQD